MPSRPQPQGVGKVGAGKEKGPHFQKHSAPPGGPAHLSASDSAEVSASNADSRPDSACRWELPEAGLRAAFKATGWWLCFLLTY